MNVHKNAKTCPQSRALMVQRVLEEGQSVTKVAGDFGVSGHTVYKWIQRYRAAGEAGLGDRSSYPRRRPHGLGADWVALIVRLRTQYRMTGVGIAQQLQLPRSTVAGVLKRKGLSQRKSLDPPQPVRRYEHARPGEMVHLDIKRLGRFWRAGHRVTGNRRPDSPGADWDYVHVCVDDYSRLAYAEVLPDQRQHSAAAFLKPALEWFARFGIQVRRVLTDNGSCYRSARFLKRCRQLRLRNYFTRPYRPQTNGKAERFTQTLLREWAYARTYSTLLSAHPRPSPLFEALQLPSGPW